MTQMLTAACRWTAPRTGDYRVKQGRVWITRDGEAQDHVLAAGESLGVQRGDVLVIEPWTPGQVVHWVFDRSAPAAAPVRLAAWMAMALASAAVALHDWAVRLDPELSVD